MLCCVNVHFLFAFRELPTTVILKCLLCPVHPSLCNKNSKKYSCQYDFTRSQAAFWMHFRVKNTTVGLL
jgi:hypothetical protein